MPLKLSLCIVHSAYSIQHTDHTAYRSYSIQHTAYRHVGLDLCIGCRVPTPTRRRNTKVYDLVNYLKSKGLIIHIADPWVQKDELNPEIKKIFYKYPKNNNYDGIIISVKHKCFSKFGIKKIKNLGKKKATILDLKNLFPNEKSFLRI